MNSVNFNSTISSGNSTNNIIGNNSNNIRQSRLIQPTGRYSYAPTSSSRIISQGNASSTFLPTLSSSKIGSREVSKKGVATIEKPGPQISSAKMDTQQHHSYQMQANPKQYLNNDHIPNANTSGLPAPSSKQRSQITYSNEHVLRQQVASSPSIPSTIGSALRRRQASPSGSSIAKPITSRLPSNLSSASSNIKSDVQQASFALRRSQSQRPNQATVANQHQQPQQPQNRQSTFSNSSIKFSPKSLTSRSKSQLEQEQSSVEDDEFETEDSSKCVESLPPLKSTTYITKLMNNSSRQESRDIDAKSEPICTTNINNKSNLLTSNSFINSKPSQLVKPLMTKTSRSTTNETAQAEATKIDSTYSSVYNNSTSGKLNYSTKLPGSMLPSLASKLKNDSSSSHKRLSLQPARYNSANRDNKPSNLVSASNDHRKQQLSSSDHESDERINYEDNEGDQEDGELEDGDERGDEGGENDDDDDDDATTAETMTQMSDSNMILTSANQELNNMIQMLSSSAILGESGMMELTSDRQDLGQRKLERISSLGSTSYKMKPSHQAALSTTKTTRLKNEVIKSQSLSFATNNSKQQKTISNGSKRKFLTKIDSQSSFRNNQYSDRRNSQQCSNEDLKLPRPRSRIIFDPTNSQFHVSNFVTQDDNNEEDDEYEEERYESVKCLSNNSSGDDSSSSTTNDDLVNPLTDSCGNQMNASQVCEYNDQDEASLKLIDTHNQIITLKYLPTSTTPPTVATRTSKTSNSQHLTHGVSLLLASFKAAISIIFVASNFFFFFIPPFVTKCTYSSYYWRYLIRSTLVTD